MDLLSVIYYSAYSHANKWQIATTASVRTNTSSSEVLTIQRVLVRVATSWEPATLAFPWVVVSIYTLSTKGATKPWELEEAPCLNLFPETECEARISYSSL